MRSFLFAIALLVIVASTASAQSRFGISGAISPETTTNIFSIERSHGPATNISMRGSAFEASLFRDLGRRGERGVFVGQSMLNDKTFRFAEGYAYVPFLGNDVVQFGPLLGAGIGIGKSGVTPSMRGEATIAVKTAPNMKVKAGIGARYLRLSYSLSASLVF